MSDRPEPVRALIGRRRSEPTSPWLLTGGVVLWVGACLGLGILGAAAGISPKTLQPLKQINALGIWVWVYLMTSPVAEWKGRSGWSWFLVGSFTMWGAFIATVAGSFGLGVWLGEAPREAVSRLVAGMLLGFPVGIACTTALSAGLWRSEPLPGAPCLETTSAPPPPS